MTILGLASTIFLAVHYGAQIVRGLKEPRTEDLTHQIPHQRSTTE